MSDGPAITCLSNVCKTLHWSEKGSLIILCFIFHNFFLLIPGSTLSLLFFSVHTLMTIIQFHTQADILFILSKLPKYLLQLEHEKIPAICICKHEVCKADQQLCFHYIESAISLLPKSENANLLTSSGGLLILIIPQGTDIIDLRQDRYLKTYHYRNKVVIGVHQ